MYSSKVIFFVPTPVAHNVAQVKLSKTFVDVINSTCKPDQTYLQWSSNVVDIVLAAGPESLTGIAQALHSFCESFNALGQEGGKRGSKLSEAAAVLFARAQDVLQSCVAGILKGLAKAMLSKLLRAQAFFPKDSVFLPEVTADSKSFFEESIQFCTESNAEALRDTLKSMAAALKNAEREIGFDLDKVMDQFAEHELQAFCCVCFENLDIPEEIPVAKLKSQFQSLEQALAAMADIIKSSDSSWSKAAKDWIGKHVIAKIFGHALTVILGQLQKAIDAQPEGVETLIVSRNVEKLRRLVFNQEVHNACTHGLEEMGCVMKSLENVMTAGNSMDLMQAGFLNKVKTTQGELGRMKQYSSIVHGLNLCFHRFTNKGRLERSALLREILD